MEAALLPAVAAVNIPPSTAKPNPGEVCQLNPRTLPTMAKTLTDKTRRNVLLYILIAILVFCAVACAWPVIKACAVCCGDKIRERRALAHEVRMLLHCLQLR
jgi:hypothetical protein